MATPAQAKPTPEEKAGLLMAISQLDMLVLAFANAPAKVHQAATDFKNALQEWADGKL